MIRSRSKKWFEPELVEIVRALHAEGAFETVFTSDDLREEVIALEPEVHRLSADPDRVDDIAHAFAEVIDAKSHYTHSHSERVMRVGEVIAQGLNLPLEDRQVIRRAALLHDIGKLSVPNSILDKQGRLTSSEWETIRLHPYFSERILERIVGFEEVAFLAGAHHERRDGKGYFRNLKTGQIPMKARLLGVADVYEALTAERPYHPSRGHEEAMKILKDDAQSNRLCPQCVEVLASTTELQCAGAA